MLLSRPSANAASPTLPVYYSYGKLILGDKKDVVADLDGAQQQKGKAGETEAKPKKKERPRRQSMYPRMLPLGDRGLPLASAFKDA